MRTTNSKKLHFRITSTVWMLLALALFSYALVAFADSNHGDGGGGCDTGYDNDCDGSPTAGGPYWGRDIDDDDPSIGGWISPCGQFGCR